MKLEVLCGSHFDMKHFEVSSDAEGGSVSSSLCAEEELGSDGDCVAHSPPPVNPCSSSSSSSSTSKSKPYTRRPKPPFSYIALIAMAIRDSSCGRLTLAEINEYLMKKFPFFRGSYTGWRNSVRHNLSLNDCFLKVLRDPSRPWGKDNYWMLNPQSEYTFADGVFRRRRKRINKKFGAQEHQPEEEASERAEEPQNPPRSAAATKTDPCPKFTSSFAIDSILSTPYKRDSNTEHFALYPVAFNWPRYTDLMAPYSHTPASFPCVKAPSCHMDARAAVPHMLQYQR
ncbi:forkhead box protein Q1a [Hippoglossus stenolepis]|uniref:forkhead box protein Q1a n=1 Tax=Hippoglossus stenolepis TaxID=195615 RepID=UPI00159C9A65|nr:forkhead box protein Q1a [Hippoglossus stenolepis]